MIRCCFPSLSSRIHHTHKCFLRTYSNIIKFLSQNRSTHFLIMDHPSSSTKQAFVSALSHHMYQSLGSLTCSSRTSFISVSAFTSNKLSFNFSSKYHFLFPSSKGASLDTRLYGTRGKKTEKKTKENKTNIMLPVSAKVSVESLRSDANYSSEINVSHVSGEYDASNITVLEGLEPVRKRPGMYIGSTGSRGFHHLVYEVIDNAVDEALAGHCSEIHVVIHPDNSVSVLDNGRGIPVSMHPKTKKSALETVLTILHAGGKFGQGGYKVSGGLHGVGVSVVNALSEWLVATVWRDEHIHQIRFCRGVPDENGFVKKKTAEFPFPEKKTGTKIHFKPDPTIFTTVSEFDTSTLLARFQELAFLNAGLKVKLSDQRPEKFKEIELCHEGGIAEYVSYLCREKHPIHDLIYIKKTLNNVEVEVALQWSANYYSEALIGFANNIKTIDGGTHLDGLKVVLTRSINNLAKQAGKLKENQSNLSGDFVREGLTGIVSVKVPDPEFEGQTKSKLGNPEVRSIVDQVVAEGLFDFFELNQKALAEIFEKAMSAYEAAEAAKRARDVVRRKSILETSTLPGKLADCSSKDPEKSEIFIVEGDSAGGTAKLGRSREFQAILPLRGKILNIEKTDDSRIYKNTEIQALITALGLGVKGVEFNEKSLRYHRIIIMTDADIDGAHIRTLLLTFFFRYQKALVERGYIYIACSPLYKVERGKSHEYFYSELEMRTYVGSLPENSKYNIQRFKGLGEMMPLQLWDTTMNPKTRRMKRVTVDDAAEADRIFTILMGDAVDPRRNFIQEHAASLHLDDIDF